ncbi:hypothetical protein JWG45_03500 [Leptospira sp. 201903070]|uniref:Restriction endonuclease n=1 Tax=Leptospira ainlahdjerensis TaxID=2810033 RepID=A0ABS2U778_9LEPT|nr:hypothetical protein [Leptospira ainlahdjerensis]MBM9576211.1 hypothetical protein [Leptospira ainlahdjerensis]
MSKLFAEEHLNVPWLIKPKHLDSSVIIHNNEKLDVKFSVGSSSKNAELPDFIGLDKNIDWHVLESKGRASYDKNEHQHAIEQASTVRKINNKKPITASASYIILNKDKFEGKIIDPEPKDSFHINVDDQTVIQHYYHLFQYFSNQNYFLGDLFNRSFRFFLWMIPDDVLIGIDANVIEASKKGKIDYEFMQWHSENSNLIEENDLISIGKDGIVAITIKGLEKVRITSLSNISNENFLLHPYLWRHFV